MGTTQWKDGEDGSRLYGPGRVTLKLEVVQQLCQNHSSFQEGQIFA
jgi:hypothetical protein